MDDHWAEDIKKKKEEYSLEVRSKRKNSVLPHRKNTIRSKTFVNEQNFNKRYIIKFNNPYRIIWDLLIIILACFNCITIPLEIAFKPEFRLTPSYGFLDYFVDIIFLVDIFINFRTTVLNKYGEEIEDPKKIARSYVLSL